MRQMKDSGIEWIGEIPNNWDTIQIKHTSTLAGRIGWQGLTSAEYIDQGAYLITGVDFKQGIIDWSSCVHVPLSRWEEAPQIQIKEGDLLITKDGTVGKVAIARNVPGETSLNSGVLLIRNRSNCDTGFLFWMLQSEVFWRWFGIINAGASTIIHLYQHSFNEFRFPLPSIDVQRRIADYLDSKCSQIDSIIEKQEAIIEKLKEYKLSVITEAVTKGLDPDVEMKDSGVEWLGLYPSHWDYLSFKNVLIERMEKNDPIQTDERLSLSIDKGVTLYSDKTTNLDRFKDDVSQYKLAHEGDLVLNSMNMIVGAIGISNWFGCVSPAYYTYYDHEEDHITARYCDYLLRCKTMRKVLFSLGKGIMAIDRGDDRVNTCRLKVSRTDLRALKIPLPPVDEQRRIVHYLVNKERSIDKTIADRERSIEVLQQYKKSLIYEVVTGKKEV